MEVNSGHLLSLADSLFERDEGEGEVELDFADFLRVLVHLRPGTDASVMDVAETRKTFRRIIKKTESKLEEVHQAIEKMKATPQAQLSALKKRIQKLPDVIRVAKNRTKAAEAQARVLQQKLASR